ncbi:MAG: hypothetical protein KAI70_02825 [Candidatus Omnitrophica bacterium]|nr:hypothetical protein [Candidatus Omnitrophota bacterium]
MVRRVLCVCFVFIVTCVFLSRQCSADVIVSTSMEKYQGKIIDVKPNQLLLAVREDDKVCVMSFEKDKIHKIEVEHFTFSEKFASIRLIPVNSSMKAKLFDEIVLEKGASFSGLMEIEAPEAVYFSLLSEGGVGIVEFRRDGIVGVQVACGFKRVLAKLYFWWKYFVCNCVEFMDRRKDKLNTSTIDGKPICEWKEQLEQEEIGAVVGKRRIFTPRALKEFLGGYYLLDEDERYELGVRDKYLILGMNHNYVKSILGESPNVSSEGRKEYWNYPNGSAVTFHRGRLVGYTRNSREAILRETELYFGEKS